MFKIGDKIRIKMGLPKDEYAKVGNKKLWIAREMAYLGGQEFEIIDTQEVDGEEIYEIETNYGKWVYPSGMIEHVKERNEI